MVVEGELRAGLRMAIGTSLARLTGYLRSILLVAALGNALHADLFTIANTIPNTLVVLLGAGVFNAVLVPQVVRARQEGAGAEYVNQVITLFGALLLLATVAITLAAPWVTRLFLSPALSDSRLAEQHHAVVAFAYYCLPQVFFYGVFTLVGQILNASGEFGPMMWAPVLNNVVAVTTLTIYLATYGTDVESCAAYGSGQVRLLGVGTTAGVVLQCLVLVPYLRRAGIRYRPSFRFSARIRTTLRIGAWTLAFVLVNQVVYAVVVRLASAGAAGAGSCGQSGTGTGYTIYSSAYLLIMAPHAVVTVSLMTAALPGLSSLAATGALPELGRRLAAALRLALVVLVPGICLLLLSASSVADLAWGYGAGAGTSQRFGPTLGCFAVALFFFTCQYVALRGLYALEATRAIFWIQVVIGAVNVGLALALVRLVDAARTAPALACAYAVAYAVGAAVSWSVLRRRLGTVDHRATLATLARVGACSAVAAAGSVVLRYVLHGHLPEVSGKAGSLANLSAVTTGFAVLFALTSRVVRVRELEELRATLLARRPTGRGHRPR